MSRDCQIIFSLSFVDAESIVVEVLKEHFKFGQTLTQSNYDYIFNEIEL